TGPVRCDSPRRGVWGGPPREIAQQDPGAGNVKPATDLAFAPRDAVKLASAVLKDVPEIDLHAEQTVAAPGTAPLTAPGGTAKKKSGCGCQTTGSGDGPGAG